jgi:hypothetical protein
MARCHAIFIGRFRRYSRSDRLSIRWAFGLQKNSPLSSFVTPFSLLPLSISVLSSLLIIISRRTLLRFRNAIFAHEINFAISECFAWPLHAMAHLASIEWKLHNQSVKCTLA